MKDRSILIIGPSGSGKTFSGRNLDPKTTTWIVPEKKSLPFRGADVNYKTEYTKKDPNKISSKSNLIPEDRISEIKQHLININKLVPTVKTVVIDTFTYAMLRSVMDKFDDSNFNKYLRFADEFKKLVDLTKTFRNDLFIIFTAHDELTEEKGETIGRREFKIPAGKFTKEKIVPEGLFTVVLYTKKQLDKDGLVEGYFVTQDGSNYLPAKSPMGMFPSMYIDNDIDFVRKCYFAFYSGKEVPEETKKITVENF